MFSLSEKSTTPDRDIDFKCFPVLHIFGQLLYNNLICEYGKWFVAKAIKGILSDFM